MLEQELKEALSRYSFLLETLNTMNEKEEQSIKDDDRWFATAPKICKKFIHQAVTLQLLFSEKTVELKLGKEEPFEDLSAIYSTIRMQFETHGLFHHLFVRAEDIEENILRFRLWELDGIRLRIAFNEANSTPGDTTKIALDQQYLLEIEEAIRRLNLFNNLSPKIQQHLLNKAMWRFTSETLAHQNLKPISYSQLIKNTGIKDYLHTNLYAHLSAHTHPSYLGIMQNSGMEDGELVMGKYVAVILAGFVTAFMVYDMASRFSNSRNYLEKMKQEQKDILYSLLDASRKHYTKF